MGGKPDKPLTPAQERACQEYVKNGGNQSEAYRVAYPKSRKWKPEAVWNQAYVLFSNPEVAARVAELQRPAAREAQLTAARLLQEAARLAFHDPRRLQDAEGRWLPMHEWPDELAACVSSVEFDTDEHGQSYVSKVRFWDKNAALEKLFKNKGLFEADNSQRTAASKRLESLSPEEQQAILERLNAIRGTGLDRQSEPGRSGSTTH